MSVDLKTLTPDASLPTTGFVFGADSQASASPSVYTTAAVATAVGLQFPAGAQATPSISTTGDNDTGIWFPAANTVAASTAGQERVRITSTGNVGIGTGSGTPGGRLEVQGAGSSIVDARLRVNNPNTSSNSTAILDLYANGRTRSEIYGQQDGTGLGGFLIFNTSTSAGAINEAMRITSAGNVGIGVSNIQTDAGSLQLFGRDRTGVSDLGIFAYNVAERFQWAIGPGTQANNNGVAKMWRMLVDKPADPAIGSSFSLQTYTGFDSSRPGNYVPTTGWADRLTVTGVGNVGIGTQSPSYYLDVVKNSGDVTLAIRSESSGASLFRMIASTQGLAAFNQIQSLYGSTLSWSIGGNGSNDTIAFNIASTERMRIDTSGNVLLGGTASPTTGTQCLTVETGTAPTATPADTISLFSTDLSAGNTILSLRTEGTPVNANTTAAATHRIAVRINGTVYYLLANTAA